MSQMSGLDRVYLRYSNNREQAVNPEERQRYRATVSDIETHYNGYGNELLVTLESGTFIVNGKSAFDTMIMTGGKWSENLEEGDEIEFDARMVVKAIEEEFDLGKDSYPRFEYWPVNHVFLQRPSKVVVLKKGGVDYLIEKMNKNWHRGF